MAHTSPTDVQATFDGFTLTGKRKQRDMRSHFENTKESQSLFDEITSNVEKSSKGHKNSVIRSLTKPFNAARRLQESHLSVSKKTKRSHSSEDEEHHVSHLNATREELERRWNEGEDFEENRTNMDETSDVSSSSTVSSYSGKRVYRKRMTSNEGSRPKASASKKDALWRQNSRSRRLVANARERTRIHILSDAFENLRRAVPSYSQDQKLSKLAILKLATSYISALANLAESDTSARSLKQFADCVAHCTKALQTEGRARRKQF